MSLKKFFKMLFLGTIIFCAGAGVFAIVDKVKNAELFKVSSVEVKGVINSDREALTEISNNLMGLSIFDGVIDDVLVSHDPWVQKLTADRILPNSINLVVFEEKPLFHYKDGGKCYIFTGTAKRLSSSCQDVNILVQTKLDNEKALKFASMLELFPELTQVEIVLKEYNFTALIDGQLVICPYDSGLFAENYEIFSNLLKQRYKKIDYVDLTVKERIFVKGDRNGTSKG